MLGLSGDVIGLVYRPSMLHDDGIALECALVRGTPPPEDAWNLPWSKAPTASTGVGEAEAVNTLSQLQSSARQRIPWNPKRVQAWPLSVTGFVTGSPWCVTGLSLARH